MTKRGRGSGGRLALKPCVVPRNLEEPHLYDVVRDELYDLDDEALAWVASSPPLPSGGGSSDEEAVARFCLDEGIAEISELPAPVKVPDKSPAPSLRYLLTHITARCNLRCRHCFLGDPGSEEIPLESLLALAGEFADLQGLRFIVSGGEPLLHRNFRDLNERLPDFPFRSILLTNGTLLDGETVRALRFHEVQVSLDGLESSHDLIRGTGSFQKTLKALELLAASNLDLSVATMVHAANVDELEELGALLTGFRPRSWSVDVPCFTGNFAGSRDLAAPDRDAAAAMSRSWGGGYYGSSGDYACGPHLAAVMADGTVCKCGHYGDRPAGRIGEGLAAVWSRMKHLRTGDLDCRCTHLSQCRGGCRFRAELATCQTGPDPIQCFARGVPPGGDLRDAPTKTPGSERG